MSTKNGSVEANKAAARRWNEEGFNQQNVAVADELVHPNYTMRNGTESPWSVSVVGRDAMKVGFVEGFAENPGARVTIEDIFGEDDKVALRVTLYVGEKYYANGNIIYRFEDGKIIDDWYCWTMIPEANAA